MLEYKVVAGIDVGNGYVKARVSVADAEPVDVDMPSCVAYVPSSSWIAAEPSSEYMANLANELDCDVMSDAVAPGDRRRILLGRRAAASGRMPIMFDINDARPKCDDSLSGQLVCSVIAAEIVRKVYEDSGSLPDDTIASGVTCAVALPIVDFAKWRDRYRNMFENGNHVVHIHNFDHEISVKLVFDAVRVLPEGAAAQFAITSLGTKFLEAALEEARENGIPCEGETGASLISYKNTIGIDIGEGTVNFPVFRDGHVNVEASSSIDRGYGTVLSNVCEMARGTGYAPSSRKELAEFMLKPNPSPRDVRIRAKLSRLIEDECDVFVRDVVSEYTRVLRRIGLVSDVVYVYGGGADAIRESLWPRLVEASKLDRDDDIYIPVMYLSSEVSRTLNRDGLFKVAQVVAK